MKSSHIQPQRAESHGFNAQFKALRRRKMAVSLKGICDWCNQHSARPIAGACAHCRAAHGLR